jgi:hypothetical protein
VLLASELRAGRTIVIPGAARAERLLDGWSPDQHADLAQMLDRLSRPLLGEDADRRVPRR